MLFMEMILYGQIKGKLCAQKEAIKIFNDIYLPLKVLLA